MAVEEPGNDTWGGGVFRPGRGANLREVVKHGMPIAWKSISQVGVYG